MSHNEQSESGAMQQAIQRQASSPAPQSVVRCPLQESWIEIRMLDTEGNPVKGTRYRITDSAGKVSEGSLDSQGSARVEGLKQGDCSISFPALDEAAWEWV